MNDPDTALKTLKEIIKDFEAFCKSRGGASETDTRVKVIDRVLKEVLNWPESCISREDHVETGFLDYTLRLHDQPYVAVEAKREGSAFTIPHKMTERRYSLSGALMTDKRIKAAVDQVRTYCDDSDIPIKYAIATNGYTWIVFKAVREDISWKKGTARVFSSLEQIVENFTEFWNLLEFSQIDAGSLQDEFGVTEPSDRKLLRVIDRLYNANLPLLRNRYNTSLQPLINLIFEDIADQAQLEVLQQCYIHTGSLTIVQNDLDDVITKSIPEFLERDGTRTVGDDKHWDGLAHTLSSSVGAATGRLFLLLGGIGSGKTTFLKRYQRTTGKALLDGKTLWFAVDFLQAGDDPTVLETFVWRTILDELRKRYGDRNYEKMSQLKHVFADDIAVLQSTALNGLHPGAREYERELGKYVARWTENLSDYVPRLLRHSCRKDKLKPVLFVDNVDQLSPEYQGHIFLLAQRTTRLLDSITLISLREESYYNASIQKKFNAFTSHKFHIASPRFRAMIRSRIGYALDVLAERSAPGFVQHNLYSGETRSSLSDFLRIVGDSIFGESPKIVRFIEALCYGNMRLALQMFAQFLTSGVTDVDKMLAIYRRDGNYYVAFHEFCKSIMLGERKYYKEQPSPILNIFNVGSQKNASHFTGWRLILYLEGRRGESSSEGVGYVPLSEVIGAFEQVFNNRGDVVVTLDRLVRKQLVEVNTRSLETAAGASHVRVTSAGIYYSRFLAKSFAYLDLVLQDTPLNDEGVEKSLRDSVFLVDNLVDRDEQKLERVRTRFRRVETFLAYLKKEEDAERVIYNLGAVHGPLGATIAPQITQSYVSERDWIERRLLENRERYQEESLWGEWEEVQDEDDAEVKEG